MKNSFYVSLVLLIGMLTLVIIGCGQDNVSVVSVDPPNNSEIEPTLTAITVTFDGTPEGFDAAVVYAGVTRHTIDFVLSGNVVIFPGPFELGSTIEWDCIWENMEPNLLREDSGFILSYTVTSDAVVTLGDDLNILPPWPHLANFNSGDPNADSLRFEFPIHVDRPLEYDLPVYVEARIHLPGIVHYPTEVLHVFIPELPYPHTCVIEKGSTESLCTIEIKILDWHDHALGGLDLDLVSGAYSVGESDFIRVEWALPADWPE